MPDSFALPDHAAAEACPCGAPVLRATLDGVKAGLFTFDGALRIRFSSDRLAAILGIPPVVLGRCATVLQLLEASPALDGAAVQQVHEACLAATAAAVAPEPVLIAPTGDAVRAFSVEIAQVDEALWTAALEEVTARRAAEAEALERALRDPLTGLANRQLYSERLARAFVGPAAAAGFAAVAVDLDRFKAVNDTLGHPIGDTLLRLVAQRLRSVVRPDDVVARLGGDEFALLLASTAERAALAKLARRVVDMVGRPYLIEGHQVNIGASLGIAIAPADGREPDQLLRSADLALYYAKKAGRSTWSFFEPGMDQRAMARRALEIDLRKALTLREFELHFQPQIDLESHRIVGFEALLRWRHPERGLVPPAAFIPLAEEIGLIVPLGEWVLREACREAARWPDDISVAVNVSAHQFEETGRLADVAAKALAAAGLPGARLEIEITETVLLRNEAHVFATLHRLHAQGVRVAMDDFGTGYSSLSQLQSFPFDKIKIDRSFVLGGPGDERGDERGDEQRNERGAVVRAIAALGVSLGMSTIAEGVETPEQLDRIRADGCTSVQGYLFSRPVPPTEIAALLAGLSKSRVPAEPEAQLEGAMS